MQVRAGSRGDGGFTLIELIVVLSIMALMGVLLLASVETTRRISDVGQDRLEEISRTAAFHEQLKRVLAGVRPDPAGGRAAEFPFEGSSTQIRAYSSWHRSGVGHRDLVIGVAVERRDGKTAVIVSAEEERSRDDADRGAHESSRVVLVTDDELRFDYFGPTQADEISRWRSIWPAANVWPPDLVRVSFLSTESQALTRPPWIMKVPVNMDAGCISAAVGTRCRLRSRK